MIAFFVPGPVPAMKNAIIFVYLYHETLKTIQMDLVIKNVNKETAEILTYIATKNGGKIVKSAFYERR
jgi:hypothetical protein